MQLPPDISSKTPYKELRIALCAIYMESPTQRCALHLDSDGLWFVLRWQNEPLFKLYHA